MIDPKDMPRVPHATEDGLQEGRPHPALRRYQANYRVVDWAEGLKLMANRRSGKEPPIKGGVDDGSPEMSLSDAVLPGPFSKMRINPKDPVSPSQAPRRARHEDRYSPPSREELMSAPPGSVERMADDGGARRADRLDPFTPSGRDYDVPPGAVMPRFAEPADAMVAPPPPPPGRRYDELVERYESEAASMRPASEYLSGRVRMELELDSMSLSLSVVDVIESMYGVVVLMPSSGDSMTFTPRPMSDARISCQARGVSADVAYIGVSFEIAPLGVLGLAFVKRTRGGPGREGGKESVSSLVDRLKNA